MTANTAVFTCSICGEPSSEICTSCTKDACANHRCARCKRCSDCCECEVPLSAAEVVEPEAAPEPATAVEAAPAAEPVEATQPVQATEPVQPAEPEQPAPESEVDAPNT